MYIQENLCVVMYTASRTPIQLHRNIITWLQLESSYGGGIYLQFSQLNCYSTCRCLFEDTAGGGICAIGSHVSVENTRMISFQGKHAGGSSSFS